MFRIAICDTTRPASMVPRQLLEKYLRRFTNLAMRQQTRSHHPLTTE